MKIFENPFAVCAQGKYLSTFCYTQATYGGGGKPNWGAFKFVMEQRSPCESWEGAGGTKWRGCAPKHAEIRLLQAPAQRACPLMLPCLY